MKRGKYLVVMREEFCSNLKKLRGNRSQSSFAAEIGTKQTTYSAWETGAREPDLNTLCRIAAVTGRSIDELLGVRAMSQQNKEKAKIEALKKAISNVLKEF